LCHRHRIVDQYGTRTSVVDAAFAMVVQQTPDPLRGSTMQIPFHRDVHDVIVIGAGQAGLAAGYHLQRRSLDLLILEAGDRVGESWRRRWEGLRLFTAARYDGLPAMPFAAPADSYPSKDEVADHLETYAERKALPVRTGVRVEQLRPTDDGDRYEVVADALRFEAPAVVVATGAYRHGRVPAFASELDPGIRQLHSVDYRSPAQLQSGPVLVVGASNSGAEVAVGAARDHQTTLVGRDTGQMPFPIDSRRARVFDRFFWFFINHVVTLDTPIGRRAMPAVRDHGGPLERVRSADLAAAGVERIVGRIVGVLDGQPQLDDGRTVTTANVVWCTGFRPDFEWISLPVVGDDGWPRQRRGVAIDAAGLYFVGLPFLHSAASSLLGGVGPDADLVAERVATQVRSAAWGLRP
jgi:putative flavoprotein involved in K+ transport